MKNNTEAMIVGMDNHNTLGVIRSLGERHVAVNLILISNKKNTFCDKSKYVKKYNQISNNHDIILELIKMGSKNNKMVLIPTSDKASSLIDDNYKKLSSMYYISTIKNNKINTLMNKSEMNKIAEKNGINVPKFVMFNYSNYEELKKLKFPLILKPLLSIEGEKSEITICDNYEELMIKLDFFEKNYKHLLIQEFIVKDYEIGILGYCSENVLEYAITKKTCIYPIDKGNTVSGTVYSKELLDEKIRMKLDKFISNINYNGLFDIEMIIKDDELFFVEFNFRNGANGYAVVKSGFNYIYSWYLSIQGIDNKPRYKIKKKNFKDPFSLLMSCVSHEINIARFIRLYFLSSINLYLSFKDIKPFIYKIKILIGNKRR